MSMLLTDAERLRFAEWLEREALTADAMRWQAAKLGLGEAAVFVRQNQIYADAARLIVKRLQEGEACTKT